MQNVSEMDLGSILSGIKPSMVTPRLSELSNISNDKKLRAVANMIVEEMVKDYNKKDNNVAKVIMHDGEATEVRYFDIQPLLSGVWPAMSLMLLNLSYGEQTVLIESLYPKSAQFTAKAFAATFTITGEQPTGTLSIKADSVLEKKVDSANAGIAMIIAMMGSQGYKTPHPDKVNTELTNMNRLVEAAEEELNFKHATKRAQDAAKSQDK